ncbi:sulfatase [Coraliomargarita sp. SDUM461003]|uniref:Sulfatase n=1 Tax=Thalassobacterium maritimum TaxID=3041265 RepID=A0ABU1AQ92_9BACT|nr:sulfatase [Coraliomargarita sp. SDUM461003]MDQ8206336.1 sulfatase [Coraliomargarita sp. SDUM461003]
MMKKYIRVLLPLFLLIFAQGVIAAKGGHRPNILFIAVDDLKPLLSNYGDPIVKSPNFDRLAAMGVTFTNAHSQQAVCGPSRASVLTGLRPDRTRVWDLSTKIRSELPEVVTIPQHFKANGYQAVGIGKIFDSRSVEGPIYDDAVSWSRPFVQAPRNEQSALGFLDAELVAKVNDVRKTPDASEDEWSLRSAVGGVPTYERSHDVDDEAYEDGRIAATSVKLLQELAAAEAPFFLGVGFHKPHLPFNAPKRYWDLYDEATLSLAARTEMPVGAPSYHFQPGWEIRNGNYSGGAPLSSPEPIADDLARTLIHGYYACVSYIDAQLGRLLDGLESTGELENTIIVLWSDHGWHLGDHGIWCKHTNYEQATRSVYMICNLSDANIAQGEQVAAPVELLDTFATLCDLVGVNAPSDIDGLSLRPLLYAPDGRLKDSAVSQFPREYQGRKIMGYAWRSERYRYIEWVDHRFREGVLGGPVVDVELYDYLNDPEESRNLATDSAYEAVLIEMRTIADDYKKAQAWSVF